MKYVYQKLSVLLFICLGCFQLAQAQAEVANPTAPFWKTRGNSGTTGIHFIGTTDFRALRFRTDNVERMIIDSATGNVGIGTSGPLNKLHLFGVNSSIRAGGLATGGGYNSIPASSPYNILVADNVGDFYRMPNPGGSGNNYILTMNGVGSPVWSTSLPNAWGLTGNAGTVDGTNFIGTTDNVPFNIRINDLRAGRIDNTNANAFFGFQAGNAFTTAVSNSFFGHQAGFSTTTATDNSFFGRNSGFTNTNGSRNAFYGNGSGFLNTTGYANTFIGEQAGRSNTTGFSNVAVGTRALFSNIIGSNLVAVGDSALRLNTTGSSNTAIGSKTLSNNSSGLNNTAVGFVSLRNNTTGSANTALGAVSLAANTTGIGNTAVGTQALQSNNVGGDNTAIGYLALLDNTTGTENTALGAKTLSSNNSGILNTAVGVDALTSNTTGGTNTATGAYSLYLNSIGFGNTAVGVDALYSNIDGDNNSALGQGTLYSNTNGNNNTAIGYASLFSNTTGQSNTAVGRQAGIANVTGTRNTLLGDSADLTVNNLTNATAIGWNAKVSTSNSMVLGSVAGVNGSNTNIKVAIGNNAPNTSLDVKGDLALRERVLTLANGINNDVPVDSNTFFRVTGPVSLFALTGLAGGVDGKIVTLFNNTSSTMFIDAMALSLAANQILTGAGDLFVSDSGSVTMQYNSTIAKWVVTSYNNASYGATAWNLTGNASTTPGTNFMGTIDNQDVMFKRNGFQAGLLGTNNTAWGDRGLIANTTGFNNTTVGAFALDANNTGNNNTAVGISALTFNTSGSLNVALGRSALNNNSVGNSNVAVGVEALRNNSDRSNLVAIGDSALYNNGIGAVNLIDATQNTAVGSKTLLNNTTGYGNTAIGFLAARANTSASGNVAIGDSALFTNTTGSGNVAIGRNALATTNGRPGQVAIGDSALALSQPATFLPNTAIGFKSLARSTSGYQNVAVGGFSGYRNTDGFENTWVGYSAGQNNTTAVNNTFIGTQSGQSTSTGSSNTAIGNVSLFNNISGFSNVALGHSAGLFNTVGNRNTLLGDSADVLVNNLSASTALGYFAKVSASNTVIIGDTIIRPKVGIGVTAVGKTKANTFMEIARTGSANENILTRFAGSGTPAIVMQRSLGTLAAPTLTTVDQTLGGLIFDGYDGANWQNAAYIDVRVDSFSSATVMPTRIEFYTRPSVSGSAPQERMEINRNGHVGIGTSLQQTSLHVNGGLVLESSPFIFATTDDFPITVGNRSYIRVSGGGAVATDRTLILSNGLFVGQILYLECLSSSIELTQVGNVNIPGFSAGLPMTGTDVIHLIWNGSDWLTVSYSDN